MTNEDAKHWINICVQDYIRYYDNYHKEILEARDMMFKALEAQPTDEDCISRQDVVNFIIDNYGVGFASLTNGIRDYLPSVTPQRPKGKWNFIGDQMFECSSCKRAYTQNQFEELKIYTTDDLLPKYCPNCGVEMEVEE